MPLIKNLSPIQPAVDVPPSTRTALSTMADLSSDPSVQLAVTVSCDYTAGATVPAVLELYSALSFASAVIDTVPFFQATIPLQVASNVKVTFDVPASPGAVGCRVLNADPSETLGDLTVWALSTDVS